MGSRDAEPERRQLAAPRVGSAGGCPPGPGDSSSSPRREASRSSGCLLPGASSAHPASAQLGWSWGFLSVCPPQPASREPRAASSGPGPLSAALCSGDGKSWRWRRFPSRAERAPGFSVLHATGACSSVSCWVPLSQGPTPGSFLHSCYSFASLGALPEGPRQGLELWVLKSA